MAKDTKDKDKKADKGGGKPKEKGPPSPATAATSSKKEKGDKKGKAAAGDASFTPTATTADVENYVARATKKYADQVIPALTKKFSYKNPMQVPRLQKVVVNMGLGQAVANPTVIDSAVSDMRALTGQSPIVTRARKSIAFFKLRENLPIGVMVTLRRERM